MSFPLLNPYGHVAFQAQRGDVHTVLVNGRVVKHEHRLSASTCRRYAAPSRTRSTTCGPRWATSLGRGMHPDIPETKVLDNPYTYTEYRSASTHTRKD